MNALVRRLSGLPLLVVGDALLDVWSWGPPRGLSREGPVPVVRVVEQTEVPGGAANTAVAAAALGARAVLVGLAGGDRDGDRLRELLATRGVGTDGLLTEQGRATLVKRRIASGGHLHLRCDTGDEAPPGPPAADRLIAAVAAAASTSAAVLACDYDAGVFTPRLVDEVAAAARAAGRPLIVDAHDLTRWAHVRPDLVKPNAGEIMRLLPDDAARAAFTRDRVGAVHRYRDQLTRASGARSLAVTLDRDGVVLLTPGGQPWHLPALAQAPDEQTSGAGDTFVAALTLALCAGARPRTATELAATAAAVVVTSPGTSTCTARDLAARLGEGGPPVAEGGPPAVTDAPRLVELVARHHAAGRRVVFTNGCFDVLHAGHTACLEAARRLGDVLVVAVNDDAGVRRLKGPDRPINPLPDRLAVLTALAGVDHVVTFTGESPTGLLWALRPDVYVKGGDYTEQMIPEAPLVRRLGGEVRIVDYVEDHSTAGIVGRIRAGTVTVP
ncbi:D-heptose-7- phosphate 1-kinase,D-heptose-1-phosphate adenylyltransferase [Frankia sp. EI5c]|uniref:PfkB family carbohydrate kinase n=1 Tax=Frankia sp. EI5c TaxID=683316 RepID=UPI0007C3F187|nr:PfkB family carbohydrate kinase [Frankia sp. EI5c]OAA23348.1 D-heptose-7- phosphate 1-kinase,D-heptose-1-phosphate adenylyltransferase [Frankia sp. EI5c]